MWIKWRTEQAESKQDVLTELWKEDLVKMPQPLSILFSSFPLKRRKSNSPCLKITLPSLLAFCRCITSRSNCPAQPTYFLHPYLFRIHLNNSITEKMHAVPYFSDHKTHHDFFVRHFRKK